MSKKFDYDVAVIGGGSGGYAAARTAVNAGLKTVVIEGGEEVGGLCILRGCMPTKALLRAAEVMHIVKNPDVWGIKTKGVTFDFGKVMARKGMLVKEFADYRRGQLESGKFTFVRAMARFIDPHTVKLSPVMKPGARKPKVSTVSAKHFVIATGSTVAPSPLPGLDDVGYLTSDGALTLTRLPKSMIVLGGGAVAVEFAQFFLRFGVKVTLIQRSEHILHEFDKDTACELENALRREGMKVYAGTKFLSAKCSGKHKEVVFECAGKKHGVSAEEIFYGLGRIPNIASLGLENAGVHTKDRRIDTNLRMQTSASHVYAVGDCAGLHEIVHLAVIQGEFAGHNIAYPRKPKQMDYRLLTEVVFSEPQIASVGLTEKEARARKIPYLTAKYPFNDHGKSIILGSEDGFVKLLANPKTGEIIGGACVGPMGGELIHEIVAAMHKRMTVTELAAMPHYHPTLAEIWSYPAEDLAAEIKAK